MRSIAFVIVAWIVSVASWTAFIELVSTEVWDLRGTALWSVWLGAPLVAYVPVVLRPLLSVASHRSTAWRARGPAMGLLGALLASPLIVWPVTLTGGEVTDALSADGRHYLILYGAFGLQVGLWTIYREGSRRNAM